MLIQPDSYIRLVRNCPLDKSYDHTILFKDFVAQNFYFRYGLLGTEYTKQSYQRYAQGVLTIQDTIENVQRHNYLYFINSAFGNKHFYAFITGYEYVNNVTTRITYELDVMQTWMFDYTLEPSFVEREHTLTDNIGEHLVPENLETGDYIYSPVIYGEDSARITPFKSFKICILATFDENYNDAVGGYYYSTYSGLYLHSFDTASAANNFINNATSDQKSSGIVCVFMIPKEFTPSGPSVGEMPGISIGLMEYIKKNISSIDGYVPRNNKLFSMPYNSLLVTNNDGKSSTYGYEYFYEYPSVVPNDYVALNIRSSGVNTPEFCLIPWFYKGLEENHMERVVIHNTPQCGYNVDTFRAWLAQNKVNLISSIGEGVASLASIATRGQLDTSALNSVYSNIKSVIQHSTLPPTAKGNTGVGSLNINTGVFGFSIFYCTIRNEFAKIIDGYFDMFGYAVNQLKVPNRNSRPHWNYVKTTNCILTASGFYDGYVAGAVPADDLEKIRSIYNNGITFWKEGSEVGNYSLDNRPI